MKKFVAIFKKEKRKKIKENLNGYYTDAVPEPAMSSLPKTNIYKNYEINIEPSNRVDVMQRKHFQNLELNQPCSYPVMQPPQSKLVCENNFPEPLELLANGNLRTKQRKTDLEAILSNIENRNFGNLVENETSKPFLGMTNGNKSKGATYVYSISNCNKFFIGSKQIINMSNSDKEISQKTKSNGLSKEKEVEDLEKLLDSEEKLTEKDIKLISLNLRGRWKEFAKGLGVEETILDDIMVRCDNDKVLATYDILMTYLKNYPNTSLGFVVSILKEKSYIDIIQKLSEERKEESLQTQF